MLINKGIKIPICLTKNVIFVKNVISIKNFLDCLKTTSLYCCKMHIILYLGEQASILIYKRINILTIDATSRTCDCQLHDTHKNIIIKNKYFIFTNKPRPTPHMHTHAHTYIQMYSNKYILI